MASSEHQTTRRQFVSRSALLTAALELGMARGGAVAQPEPVGTFSSYQSRRREALWSLLGDLPWQHQPAPPKVLRTEQHDNYTLERLVLDLNGIEAVPALLLIPKRLQHPAPGLLFIHWHAGMYGFGQRTTAARHERATRLCSHARRNGSGHPGDRQLVFWRTPARCRRPPGRGRCFQAHAVAGSGAVGHDDVRRVPGALLPGTRPEVDSQRLGAFGMSMGSSKAWWLAALEPQVTLTVDVCCLTDYESLIAANGLSGHGTHYFVPSLLKQFDTTGVNELIVPRAHLSVNGRNDPLTPPAGVEKIRERLLPLYRQYGGEQNCRIELFDCAHEELPEMRSMIIDWMRRYLVVRAT